MKAIVLTGRLVADPEVKKVGDNSVPVANFRVANNDTDKKNGEFYYVHCWERLAEFTEGYLHKGSRVMLQGSFNNELYKDKEGKTRSHFTITATRIEFAS